MERNMSQIIQTQKGKKKSSFIEFLKKECVLVIAVTLAILSSFISIPKMSYIDFNVIILLFNLMVVVAAFKELKVLDSIAIGLLKKCLQRCDIALVEEWRSVARDVLQENSDDKIDCMNVLETVSLFKGDSLSYLTNDGTGFINQGRSLDEKSSLKKKR